MLDLIRADLKALGVLADYTSIRFVFIVCAFLPLIGILGLFLPPERN